MREQLKKTTPGDVVDFLEENQKLPSIYEDPLPGNSAGMDARGVRKDPRSLKQFPLAPPLEDKSSSEAKISDCFEVARDWYLYANEPLPPATPDLSGISAPSFDRSKYRVPRYMALPIFRLYPCRGQTYVAEYLQTDGWFGPEGWPILGWFLNDRFKSGPAIVGDGKSWAAPAWSAAHEMYRTRGTAIGAYLPPEQISAWETEAGLYRRTFNVAPGGPPPKPPEDANEELLRSYTAANKLFWHGMIRDLTNFPYFYFTSEVNSRPQTLELRKAFFDADQAMKRADNDTAFAILRDAIPKWREVILSDPDFRKDGSQQEDTFEVQIKYEKLVRELFGKRLKDSATVVYFIEKCLAQVTGGTVLCTILVPPPFLLAGLPPVVETAFDAPAPDGSPLIREEVKNQVRSRFGMALPQAAPKGQAPVTPIGQITTPPVPPPPNPIR